MCGSNSQVSSTSGPPSQFLNAYTDVYNQAAGLVQQPYQAYTGPMVAGFSPDQYAAFGTIQNTQGMAQPYYDQAASYMMSSAAPISPYAFENVGDLPGLGMDYFNWAGEQARAAATPIELMEYNIDPYLSPYTENVTNSLATLYNQQNAEQFNSARGNAAAQGAFGGDREAVLAAEMARQQKLAQDPTLAQIQQAGFASAQEEFNKQQAADLQRQLAEHQYDLAAGQLGLGIGSGLWGEFNTQQAQDVAAQQASAMLQAQAGQGLASLGHMAQSDALTGADAQLRAGQMQQQMEQQLLNVPYYQFMQQQAYPYQQLGWLSNIATGLGGASGGTSSTTYPGPSWMSQAAGLGTAGLGIYGLGSDQGWWGSSAPQSNAYYDWFNDQPFMGGGSADGGAIKRAPGGSVGLAVPPELGGAEIPTGLDSYIPGADGMGAKPANPQGGGLNKMFMQPVTTQTQSSGGGGGLGSIISLGLKALPLLLDDGGAVPAVPRGTLAQGFDDGGMPMRYQSHGAAPMVADLSMMPAPSWFGPASYEGVRPQTNYVPTFDAQGFPGAMGPVQNFFKTPSPFSIPMTNGMMDRGALGAPPAMPAMTSSISSPMSDPGLAAPMPEMPDRGGSGDGASGGHVGRGGIGHFDAGGMVYPDMSRGYIPQTQAPKTTMGPPKPPSLATPPQQQSTMSPIASFLQSLQKSGLLSGKNESLGGAVQPSATPLQYDDGGEVGAPESQTQQRALLQQYANLPVEKLRELAMRYPATTPQGAAVQRALQMKQTNPSGLATGPAGPFGPSGQTYPGTTAARGGRMSDGDWIEPPPRDWTPPPPPGPPQPKPQDDRNYGTGLAEGGFPTFDIDDVKIVDVSSDEPQGPLMPPPPPLADVPSYTGALDRPPAATTSETLPNGTEINTTDVPLGMPPVDRTNGIVPRDTGLAMPPATVQRGASASSPGRDSVVKFWMANGAPQHVAEGIADRVNAESGFSTSIMGDNGTSGGPYQHHADRLARLKEFAAKQGKPWTAPGVANEFALWEVQGGDPIAAKGWGEILNAPDRQTAATLWDKYFERSKYGPGAGGSRTLASGISPGYRATGPGAEAADTIASLQTGPEGGSLANPPSMSLKTEPSPHTMRDITSSPWAMLLATGAGMLASRSPYPGVALGEGLQTGLKMAQTGAAQEGKDEMNQVRLQSTQLQAQNMTERAEQARSRLAETATHNRQTEAQAAENASLRTQSQADSLSVRQQMADIAASRAQTSIALAESQAQAKRAREEYDREMAALKKGAGKMEYGPGPDPNDPDKKVQGMWFYPNSPDPEKPGGGSMFYPGVGAPKQSTGAAGSRKAMFDKLIADGLATDYLDAEKKTSEARRNPNGFRNSAMYANTLQRALHDISQDPTTMTLSPAEKQRRAKKQTEEFYGLGAAASAAAAGSPTPAPAPAAAPPQERIQNGWRYTLDGKPIGPVQ